MHEEERGERWQALIDARADFAEEADFVGDVVPLDSRRSEGRRRPSRKALRLNEALSDWGTWSAVEHRQRRLSA